MDEQIKPQSNLSSQEGGQPDQPLFPSVSNSSKKDWTKFIWAILIVLIIGGGVYGYVLWQGKQSAETTIPTFTPRPSYPTATWQTYHNEEYGFEIKIPKDWVMYEDGDMEVFYTQEQMDYKNEMSQKCSSSSPPPICRSDFIIPFKFYFSDEFIAGEDIKDTGTQVFNGVNFIRWEVLYSLTSPIGYRAQKDGKIYNFGVDFNDDEDELNKILSTFRFIDLTGLTNSPQPGSTNSAGFISEELLDYFIEKIQKPIIDKNGQPIEGFTPAMFLDYYGGPLGSVDERFFDNVEASQGIYKVVDGKLKFELNSGAIMHSAYDSITREGMRTFMNNAVTLTRVTITDKASVDHLVFLLSIKE